jgi:hypothetical protein
MDSTGVVTIRLPWALISIRKPPRPAHRSYRRTAWWTRRPKVCFTQKHLILGNQEARQEASGINEKRRKVGTAIWACCQSLLVSDLALGPSRALKN